MKSLRLLFIVFIFYQFLQLNSISNALEKDDINIRLDGGKTLNSDLVFSGADEGEFIKLAESNENVLTLKGDIKMKFSGNIIYAQNVVYNRNTGDVTLTGNILLDDGKNKLRADKCIFNVKENAGVLYNARSTDKPIIFNTDKIRIVNKNSYITENTDISTCEIERPHYYFRVKKLIIYKDKRAIAFNAIYVVGDIPLFYFPILPQSEDGTGIITQFGQNGRRGYFMQNTVRTTTEGGDKWKYKFDMYEKLGYFGGIDYKSNDNNTFISLGGAKYKYAEPSGSKWSNKPDPENDNWFKAVLNNDYLFNRRTGSNSYSQIRFEWMNDYEFDRYFEARREPELTSMMYQFLPPDLAARDYLNWDYTIGDHGTNHEISLKFSRKWWWWERTNGPESIDNYSIKGEYIPYADQLPVFSLKYNDSFFLFNHKDGGQENGQGQKINLSFFLEGSSYKLYSYGEPYSTTYTPVGYLLLNTDFQFLKYFTYTPGIKNGFNAQWVDGSFNKKEEDKESAEIAAKKNTYEYVEISNAVKFGIPQIYLSLSHFYRRSYLEGEVVEPFIHEKRNDFLGGLYIQPDPDVKMSVATTYDARRNYPFDDKRLKDITVSNSILLDFCRLFYNSRTSSNRNAGLYYSGIEASNNYIYIKKDRTSGYNLFDIRFTTGNFSFPGVEKIRNFEIGYNLYHDYRFSFRDIMSFKWGIYTDINKYWHLEIGANSQADRAYLLYGNNGEKFFDDFKKTLYFYDRNRSDNAVFTLRNLFVNIIHDLHCWEVGFYYNLQRRSDYWGPERKDTLLYYDHQFFISMTLKTFSEQGFSKTQVYPLEQRKEKQY